MKVWPHFMGGQWHQPASGTWLDSVNPATNEPWAQVARGAGEDVDAAVSAAHEAAGAWSACSRQERAEALERVADVLEARWGELVELEVRDNGKRVAEVRAQFAGLHHWFRHFAHEALKIRAHSLENDVPGVENTAHYEPFGVVAAITPWNSRLMIAAWKAAPALAAGNTVVIKPSEHASVSTLAFASMLGEGALPSGVLNVVAGLGGEVGAPLVRHPLVAKVSFTGSDAGGVKVAEAAAAGIKPVTLELGGKSPQLVFADADLDSVVNGVLSGIFLSNGQTCVAGSRLLVERPVHDELVRRLAARGLGLRAGDPMDLETEIAPLANAAHLEKVMGMIETAKAAGAVCVCGGERLQVEACPNGLYVAPTIFTGVTPEMALWREEVFGPVLAVTPFEDEAEAVRLANDSAFGLAAGVWTGNSDRGRRMAGKIAAGTVYINHYRSVAAGSPIGGYKRSGYGRELGPDAVKDFLQVKSVWHGAEPMGDPFPRRAA